LPLKESLGAHSRLIPETKKGRTSPPARPAVTAAVDQNKMLGRDIPATTGVADIDPSIARSQGFCQSRRDVTSFFFRAHCQTVRPAEKLTLRRPQFCFFSQFRCPLGGAFPLKIIASQNAVSAIN